MNILLPVVKAACEAIKALSVLFGGSKITNFIRFILVFVLCVSVSIYYIDMTIEKQGLDPFAEAKHKTDTQDLLLDLAKRCGKGCFAMKIAIKNTEDGGDGRAWSVFGYYPKAEQIIEVSSMEQANPLNKNRFPISYKTYKELIENAPRGIVRTLTVAEIRYNYQDLWSTLINLRSDIEKYSYVIQKDENGVPMWIVAIAIVKNFTPTCRYYKVDDCNELLLGIAKDIYESEVNE